MILHFERWGNAPKNIVFLHGLGGIGKLWRPLAADLEKNFTVLAPDQRGHGQSPVSGPEVSDFSPTAYAKDISETWRANQWPQSPVVGHSMGVRSAIFTALQAPELVTGLVLVDLGLKGIAGGGLGDGLRALITDLPMEFATRDQAREYLKEHSPDPAISQYLMAVMINHKGQWAFPFQRTAILRTIAAAEGIELRLGLEELGKRKLPVLLLRGGLSKVWKPEDYAIDKEKFKPYPSIAFETFEDAGHGLPFEKRSRFVTRLKDFLSNC